jgi:hypothetical protein
LNKKNRYKVKTSNGKVFPIAYQTMSPQNIREKGEKN